MCIRVCMSLPSQFDSDYSHNCEPGHHKNVSESLTVRSVTEMIAKLTSVAYSE